MVAGMIGTTIRAADQKPCQQWDDLFDVKGNLGDGPFFADWTRAKDCCSWNGVGCNADGMVTAIVVNTSDTTGVGVIPDNLAKFTALETLVIGNNLPNIVGPIPADINSLTNLTYLEIIGTNLSGHVPPVLGQIPSLNTLVLSNNRFDGGVVSLLASATKQLEDLDLRYNFLSGSLPTTLPPALKALRLGGNKFEGEIPADVAEKWRGLEVVDLANNQLKGNPKPIFDAGKSSLRILYLDGNQFWFNMTAAVLPTGLTRLDLSHNQIYWTISQQVNDLTNLEYFSVSKNQLFGAIPSGVLSNMPPSAFENNICLCDPPLPSCPCCMPKNKPSPPPPANRIPSHHVDLLQHRFLPPYLRQLYV